MKKLQKYIKEYCAIEKKILKERAKLEFYGCECGCELGDVEYIDIINSDNDEVERFCIKCGGSILTMEWL